MLNFEPKSVDQTDDVIETILNVAIGAADAHCLGPKGRRYTTVDATVAEGITKAAVLHLLELGLVVPNPEIRDQAFTYPMGRAEDRG